jgi:hypothetical protein
VVISDNIVTTVTFFLSHKQIERKKESLLHRKESGDIKNISFSYLVYEAFPHCK